MIFPLFASSKIGCRAQAAQNLVAERYEREFDTVFYF